MRILLSAVGGHGHLQPLLPLAEAARRAGHHVLVTAAASLADHVSALGLPFESSGPDLRPVHSDLVRRTLDEERCVLRTHFAGDVARFRAADLLALIRQWEPDVVVRDEVDFGAAVAAEAFGCPHAVVVVLPAGGFLLPEVVREPLAALRASYELATAGTDAMLAGDLALAPFPAAFRDPGHPLPTAAVHYRPRPAITGPSGGRHVHVTLGTIFNTESGDLLARLVRGAADVAGHVTVATGWAVPPESLGTLPSHVTVHRFVDQAAVLGSCAAVVSHGGSGTVLDALRRGVPMVNLPLGADQSLNAARCEDLGVGLTLDAHTVDRGSVAAAVTEVLTDGQYADAARRLRHRFDELPGVERALAAIEALPEACGRSPLVGGDV